MPELVEKKDPPITTSIKKINDRFAELSSRENPMLEILLTKDKNSSIKLLSKLRKVKKINNKVKR
tara:strand:- start:337 stop:531 length:195 start_codon:yes stop_codon:yes gene_type:complete